MKMRRALIAIGIFVLLVVAVQPAYAGAPAIARGFLMNIASSAIITEMAQLNAAAGKLDGLLNAYAQSINRDRDNDIAIQTQLNKAADDLSSSLTEFNAAVAEVYPTLTEEEQLAVRQTYALLDLYLHSLAADAEVNAVPAYLLSQIMQMNDTIKAVIQNLRV